MENKSKKKYQSWCDVCHGSEGKTCPEMVWILSQIEKVDLLFWKMTQGGKVSVSEYYKLLLKDKKHLVTDKSITHILIKQTEQERSSGSK